MPDSTMKARWYLLQTDIESTLKINPLCTSNGKYYCMLLSKHPNIKHKSKNQEMVTLLVLLFYNGKPLLSCLGKAIIYLLDHSDLNPLKNLIASVKYVDLNQCQKLRLECE